MSEPRRKRLYRVEATNQRGVVVYRRDYQSWNAAVARGEQLLQGIDEPGNPRLPEDDGRYVEPAAKVTIQASEVVEFRAVPNQLWFPSKEQQL